MLPETLIMFFIILCACVSKFLRSKVGSCVKEFQESLPELEYIVPSARLTVFTLLASTSESPVNYWVYFIMLGRTLDEEDSWIHNLGGISQMMRIHLPILTLALEKKSLDPYVFHQKAVHLSNALFEAYTPELIENSRLFMLEHLFRHIMDTPLFECEPEMVNCYEEALFRLIAKFRPRIDPITRDIYQELRARKLDKCADKLLELLCVQELHETSGFYFLRKYRSSPQRILSRLLTA